MKSTIQVIIRVALLTVVSATVFSQSNDRIAVISGGGAYGAWGAGLSNRLYKIRHANRQHHKGDSSKCNNCGDYKIVIGTSTGSLMAPFVLTNKYSELRNGYTSVTPRKIFNVNPFKKNGELRGFLFLLWRFIFYNSLGASAPLKDLVKEFYSEDVNKMIQQQNKELIVTVANMTDGEPYYMSSRKYAYDNTEKKFGGKKHSWNSMVNWTWASANEPVFMSVFKTSQFDTATLTPLTGTRPKKNKGVYVWQDGGITQAVSLMEGLAKAVEYKIYNVDVIVHGTLKTPTNSYNGTNAFKGLARTIGILSQSVEHQNIEMGILKEQAMKADCSQAAENFIVTVYYMSEAIHKMQPNENELVFNKAIMNKMYDAGLNSKPDSTSFTVPVPAMIEFIRTERLRKK